MKTNIGIMKGLLLTLAVSTAFVLMTSMVKNVDEINGDIKITDLNLNRKDHEQFIVCIIDGTTNRRSKPVNFIFTTIINNCCFWGFVKI